MLAYVGVTRLVATQYARTQHTLEPLAQRLKLKVEVRNADKTTDLVKELEDMPDGAVVVIASHSNVIPRLVRELAGAPLSGVEGDSLSDDDYRRVVVITEPCGGKPFVMELSSDQD
jgi:broad specificity phosphatase PhoE